MARLLGIDIPNEKRIEASLQYVYGIGPKLARRVLDKAEIDIDKRTNTLTESELASIRNTITELKLQVEGELKRVVTQNIKRLVEIKSYRGDRHKKGLPTRGQRTSTNGRTRKGRKKTVGGIKKKSSAKT